MDQQNSPQIQDPNNPQHIASLNFVPHGPESANIEIPATKPPAESSQPIIETTIKNIETAPKSENEPLYETPATKSDTNDTKQTPQNIIKAVSSPKILGKSNEVTHLHHIQHPQDKLTAEADKEEEDFITEVETAHGHK